MNFINILGWAFVGYLISKVMIYFIELILNRAYEMGVEDGYEKGNKVTIEYMLKKVKE